MAHRTAPLSGVAAVGLIFATGCVVPPSRPGDSGDSPRLEIRGPNHLQVDVQVRLTAWLTRGADSSQVFASWTSEGAAVGVRADGMVAARSVGVATVRATANGQTAAFVVDVVPNLAGVWRGIVTVVDGVREHGTGVDPCQERRGLAQPMTLGITHLASSADQLDLIVTGDAFVPAARGTFYGAIEASGAIFLQGNLERQADRLHVAATFRGQLDGDRIRLSPDDPSIDRIELPVSLRTGSGDQMCREVWEISPLIRQ